MTEKQEYIGLIDGGVLELRRRSDEVELVFGEVTARLSLEGASRLADRLVSDSYCTDTPADTTIDSLDQPRRRETIYDLIEEKILSVGTVLTLKHYGLVHQAIVTTDGLDIDGHQEQTPSAAGKHVTGQVSCDGWQAWKMSGGRPLSDLRWRFRARKFPGDKYLWIDKAYNYAASTIAEKRRIIERWVNYALSKDLDPGDHNEEAVEDFLSGNRYAETTLASYRGHLSQWFDLCDRFDW